MTTHHVIWITGASSGIGQALCRYYAEQGCTVVATARSQVSLEQSFAAMPEVHCLAGDVTDGAKMKQLAEVIAQRFNHINELIVNAGNCEYIDELPVDVSLTERLMAVNYHGAINTINAGLPLLQNCPEQATIIGVCSQVIFAPFCRSEAYGASKAALDYFLQSLRIDLKAASIDVSIAYPGFVKTPLTDKNTFDMPFLISAEQAAIRIDQGLSRQQQRIIFPRRLKLMLGLSRWLPSLWQRWMLKGQTAQFSEQTTAEHSISTQDSP
ncbi:Fatty acyl-CoA reductase [Sinobacterium norvegicum]|uniref:Fatty acyl-CoA reductase n=1 Tax=Sinobacterium norvegicum TaxID=1641715 RepID=A0ABM9AE69_9GAMM|nr:SDR family NAD(P)-dependent oxidoreductase [Sinobacterium norvegicum]CAH0991227.1 Fatty acyl-CoA reductase [Sinobacterium norvegicum]